MEAFGGVRPGRTGNRHPRLRFRAAVSRSSDPGRAVPVRVVLFDMDDTLFDHSFALRRALALLWRDEARLRRRPLRSVNAEYERLLEEIHPEVLRHQRTHAEARRERFLRLFDWAGSPLPAAELEAISVRYREAYQAARRPVEGAPALLRLLRGRVTVGIVSNNHTAEQADKLAATGLAPLVDFLLTSEDAGAEKPNPKIFEVALERAGARPEEAVMVGDTWATDILGARAAGIRAVWLNRRSVPRPDDERGVVELRSLRPVGPLVDQLAPRIERPTVRPRRA
jgi:putative hydrolase of the HAD superfamily